MMDWTIAPESPDLLEYMLSKYKNEVWNNWRNHDKETFFDADNYFEKKRWMNQTLML